MSHFCRHLMHIFYIFLFSCLFHSRKLTAVVTFFPTYLMSWFTIPSHCSMLEFNRFIGLCFLHSLKNILFFISPLAYIYCMFLLHAATYCTTRCISHVSNIMENIMYHELIQTTRPIQRFVVTDFAGNSLLINLSPDAQRHLSMYVNASPFIWPKVQH